MGTKKPESPGATSPDPEPTASRAVPAADPPFPTALHWIGKAHGGGYLPELGQRDHSEAAMQNFGRDLWQAALASGYYRPTTAHVRDRGMPDPAHVAPRPQPKKVEDSSDASL